jgi:hypothetical protein
MARRRRTTVPRRRYITAPAWCTVRAAGITAVITGGAEGAGPMIAGTVSTGGAVTNGTGTGAISTGQRPWPVRSFCNGRSLSPLPEPLVRGDRACNLVGDVNLNSQYVDRKFGARWVITGVILSSAIVGASLPGRTWADSTSGQAGTAEPSNVARNTGQHGGVDGLIVHLHQAFKITPAQETLFQNLADVMRQDAETMSALAKTRAEGAKTRTAVDDLTSYSEIAEAHAEGTKKMIPPFQALYASMSDSQKKAADEEFREHYAAHHHLKH